MKFIITGKTFDNSDYKKEVKDIVELWDTLKQISLDGEIRDDRVLSSTVEVETVGVKVKGRLPTQDQIEDAANQFKKSMYFPDGEMAAKIGFKAGVNSIIETLK
jgi:hypothetical protein